MSGAGRTKGAGWEIGVSKTVGHPIDEVWDFLTSAAGTALWLGHGVRELPGTGEPYETKEGTVGETRSYRPGDRIRLTWRPEDWDHDSTVQIAVNAKGPDRTTVTFHQERLTSAAERDRQRTHWRTVADAVVEALDARAGRRT